MKDFIDKLSSYNIFNNLFPGVVFVVIASKLTTFNFIKQDILVGAFVYYFIGLVISRVGSIFIEPFLKFIKFVKFAEYKRFVRASKADTRIETLSEVNNMYRTICSLFVMLIAIRGFDWLSSTWLYLADRKFECLILFLFLLFLFSYRKQTNYITKRIDANE